MKALSAICLIAICTAQATARADIIYLNTGGVVKGKVVKDDGSEITIRTKHGQTTISRDDIDRIDECESVAQLYYDKLEKLPAGDADAHFKLGKWLESIHEPQFASDEFEKTVILNPDHKAARAELGYVKKDGKWVKKDAKPKTPKVVVKKAGKKPEDAPSDEHNLLTGASKEVKALVAKLNSASAAEREDALKKLLDLRRWGDMRPVQEYMRYREAQMIITLQQYEGEILNLLPGQLDGDVRERQSRWFKRFKEAKGMRERLHSYKTLEMLLKDELAGLKKLGKDQAGNVLGEYAKLGVFLKETQGWLKERKQVTTEFGTCLTDVHRAALWARAGDEKKSLQFASKLEALDKYMLRIVFSWSLEEESSEAAKKMLSQLNSLREADKLPEVKLNELASKAAMGHARDMYVNEFFSHISPTFGTPTFRLQRQFSLKVNWKSDTEGELISKSSSSCWAVCKEWLSDKSAKETLLGKDWKSVGIANLGTHWVVIFLRK